LARSRSTPQRRLRAVVHCPSGLAHPPRTRRRRRRLQTGEEHVIAFAEEAYSLGIDGGYEFATNLLRFTYSSMTTPSEVWDYDLAARTRRLRKRQEVPSSHDPSNYVTSCFERPQRPAPPRVVVVELNANCAPS
jgi:hypothetical protein